MKILILGGDGFCGWPTSLHLSNIGHDIHIIDNFSRRTIDLELGISSLTPIATLDERLAIWEKISGKKIDFSHIDVASEYDQLLYLLNKLKPDAIIHFAEQRAAPYSMKSPSHKRYTVNNNVNATHNIICAITEAQLDTHLVHLGTMGVYGYTHHDSDIPEGYLEVEIATSNNEKIKKEILHPTDPGSIYHMTKSLDQLLFYFYNKNDKLRITDLHQGIVWGIETTETKLHPTLINRFDYDGDFGTVLNRFLMQAVIGHPLTVHGIGGQSRGFINIQDTVRCIEYALSSPPTKNERVQIFNQLTECFSVIELAKLISEITGINIQYLNNPRKEAPENNIKAISQKFLNLGLSPIKMNNEYLKSIMNIAKEYIYRANKNKIICHSTW